MKINTDLRQIESHGIQSTKVFSINATAKAFKILSSSLYKNKIKAIVRELGCNALDAHVAAGNTDQPFEVHLPTNLEPWFSVKDFGTGLSHESIETIYTSYFLSTKTDSNDYIGALGLGSKSPFSYVDSYTTVSIFNGEKSTYVAALNEYGEPSCNLIQIQETDEPNGLEVIVPVNQTDFRAFVEEANLIYRWFPLRPVSNVNLQYPEMIKNMTGTNWSNIKQYNSGGCVVLMGNIMYPIDQTQIRHDFIEQFTRSKDGFFVIHAGIGEVDITAGREELSYDKTTIAWIRAALDNVQREYEEKVAETIANAENLITAHKLYREFVSALGENVFKTIFKYKDIIVNTNSPRINFDIFPDVVIQEYSSYRSKYSYEIFNLTNSQVKPSFIEYETVTYAWDNGEKGNADKFRYWRTGHSKYVARMFCSDPVQRKAFEDYYSGIDIQDVSKWDKRPSRPRVKNPPTRCMAYEHKTRYISSDEIDVDAGGLYINTRPRNHTVYFTNGHMTYSTFGALADFFFPNDSIIFPNQTIRKKMGDNWLPFEKALEEKLNEYFSDPINVAAIEGNPDQIPYNMKELLKRIGSEGSLADDHPLKIQSKIILSPRSSIIVTIDSAIRTMSFKIKTLEGSLNGVDSFVKKINEKYPLFSYISHVEIKKIIEYIKLCDLKGN